MGREIEKILRDRGHEIALTIDVDFVQVAICWLQIEVIGDSIQPGHVLLDIVQLRYLRGGVAQQFENLA